MTFIPQHSATNQAYRPKMTWVPAKNFIPQQKLSKDIITKIWSPIVYHNNYRCGLNFKQADWLVLDFDEGLSLAEITDAYCDHIHVIGLSRNHQKQKDGKPACDRFRLCLLFETTITDPAVYKYNVERWAEKLDTDRSCTDWARGYFPCSAIHSIERDLDAYRVDVRPPTKTWLEAMDSQAWDGKPERLSRWAIALLSRPIVEQENPSRHQTGWRLAKDLLKTGRSQAETYKTIREQVRFLPDLPDKDVRHCVRSAFNNLKRGLAYAKKEK